MPTLLLLLLNFAFDRGGSRGTSL